MIWEPVQDFSHGRGHRNPEHFTTLLDPAEAAHDLYLMNSRIWNYCCWISKYATFPDCVTSRVNVRGYYARKIAVCINQSPMCTVLYIKPGAYCSFPYSIELYWHNIKNYPDWRPSQIAWYCKHISINFAYFCLRLELLR
jgi:hypothetical protein